MKREKRTMTIDKGETGEIKLSGMGGAGYSWEPGSYDSTLFIVKLESGVSEEEHAGLPPGASLPVLVIIHGIRPGKGEVVLLHKRTWEADSDAIEQLKLEVTVR